MNQSIPEIQIRNMKPSELDKVCTIVANEIYGGADVNDIREWVQSMGKPSDSIYTPWYVAVSNDTEDILGCIRYMAYDIDFKGKQVVFEISLLGLDSQYQNQGLGAVLVNKSRQILYKAWEEKGFTPVMIFLETDEENMRARRFYNRVLDEPDSFHIRDLWGVNAGMIFYFKVEKG